MCALETCSNRINKIILLFRTSKGSWRRQRQFLPHSRKVPGAAITRSGLVGILNLDLALTALLPPANEAGTRLKGFAAVPSVLFVPKLRIRVTWRLLSCWSESWSSLSSSSPGRWDIGDNKCWAKAISVWERHGINLQHRSASQKNDKLWPCLSLLADVVTRTCLECCEAMKD